MNKTLNRQETNELIVVILLILSMMLPLFMPLLQVSADPMNETRDIHIEKVWNGEPTDFVEITLFDNNGIVDNLTITADDDWKASFTNLLKMDVVSGEEISYTVQETEIKGYEVAITGSMAEGFVITNTQSITLDENQENNEEEKSDKFEVPSLKLNEDLNKTSLNVEKQWIGQKLSHATIELLVNGSFLDRVELNNSNNWKHTFDELDTHYDSAGIEVKNQYSIREVPINGYQTIITNTGNNFVVINIEEIKNTPVISETFDLNITQAWVGTPASSSTVSLYVDGAVEQTLTLNNSNGWEGSFNNLEVFDNLGERYNYQIREVGIDGYTTVITGTIEDGFVVTSTEAPGTVSVRVDKIWIGGELSQAVVALVAGTEIVDTVTLTSAKNWSHNFTNLPSEANGQPINYSVMEYESPGYQTEITGSQRNGFVIKNTKTSNKPVDNHNPSKIFVNVRKVWNSGGENSATVALVSNGEVINVAVLEASNSWTHTFFELPLYDEFNKVINYSVMEFGVEGYISKTTGNQEDGFVITNTKTSDKPNQPSQPVQINTPTIDRKTTVAVTKVWVGGELENTKINLIADDRLIDSATLTKANNWKHTFVNLPATTHGKPIDYKVEELKVEGYKSQITGNARNGFVVINTKLEPGETPVIPSEPETPKFQDLKVTKTWVGEEAEEAEFILYSDGEEIQRITLNPENNWEYTFKDLLIANEGYMDVIIYDIEEVPIENYEAEIFLTYADDRDGRHTGWVITNYRLGATRPDDDTTVDVHVRTIWVGRELNNNTANLIKDGEMIEQVILSKNNKWEHSFRDLPKYDNGRLIMYSISSEPIKGYKTEIEEYEVNGHNIRNIEDGYQYEGAGDRAPGAIRDVQTYDGGSLMMAMSLILSIIALAFITRKKKLL